MDCGHSFLWGLPTSALSPYTYSTTSKCSSVPPLLLVALCSPAQSAGTMAGPPCTARSLLTSPSPHLPHLRVFAHVFASAINAICQFPFVCLTDVQLYVIPIGNIFLTPKSGTSVPTKCLSLPLPPLHITHSHGIIVCTFSHYSSILGGQKTMHTHFVHDSSAPTLTSAPVSTYGIWRRVKL